MYDLNRLSQKIYKIHLKLASTLSFDIWSLIERRSFITAGIIFYSSTHKQIRKFKNLFSNQISSQPPARLQLPTRSTSNPHPFSHTPSTSSFSTSLFSNYPETTTLTSHSTHTAERSITVLLPPNPNLSPNTVTAPSNSTCPSSTSCQDVVPLVPNTVLNRNSLFFPNLVTHTFVSFQRISVGIPASASSSVCTSLLLNFAETTTLASQILHNEKQSFSFPLSHNPISSQNILTTPTNPTSTCPSSTSSQDIIPPSPNTVLDSNNRDSLFMHSPEHGTSTSTQCASPGISSSDQVQNSPLSPKNPNPTSSFNFSHPDLTSASSNSHLKTNDYSVVFPNLKLKPNHFNVRI
jgi:hypothetical protein